jgi:hypothetical protein
LVETNVDGSVDGGEFLQTSHAPETEHGPLSSPRRQVRIFSPVVQAATRVLLASCADLLQRHAIRAQPIRSDHRRPTVLAHCFLQELQRRLLAAHLRDEAFQDFDFMLDRPPKIMLLVVNLHEYLVQMPLLVRALDRIGALRSAPEPFVDATVTADHTESYNICGARYMVGMSYSFGCNCDTAGRTNCDAHPNYRQEYDPSCYKSDYRPVPDFVGSELSPRAQRPPTETTSRHCLGDSRLGIPASPGNHVCNVGDPSRDQNAYRVGTGRRA